jgi:hypothetical protein
MFLLISKFLTIKSSGGHQARKRKKKGRKNLSPRNRKACHSISTAFLFLFLLVLNGVMII